MLIPMEKEFEEGTNTLVDQNGVSGSHFKDETNMEIAPMSRAIVVCLPFISKLIALHLILS